MAWVGLLIPSVEVLNQASFIVIFPLTFLANTFVPLESLPGPLEAFAEWNPVSAITQAARELFGNTALVAPSDAWPLQHPVALHAGLGRDHPRGVRAADEPAVPPGGEPLGPPSGCEEVRAAAQWPLTRS